MACREVTLSNNPGLGLGFGFTDYLIVPSLVILSPFMALDVLGIIIGGGFWRTRLLFCLFRAPWREIARVPGPVAKELYKVWIAIVWLRRIDRLIGGRRNRR
jgi:hypothetical protein